MYKTDSTGRAAGYRRTVQPGGLSSRLGEYLVLGLLSLQVRFWCLCYRVSRESVIKTSEQILVKKFITSVRVKNPRAGLLKTMTVIRGRAAARAAPTEWFRARPIVLLTILPTRRRGPSPRPL